MPSPKILLDSRNLYSQKKLGQNFLNNPAVASMIVSRSKIESEDVVLEIGAGLGAITIPVARIARKVFAVDVDSRIIKLLKIELLENDLSNVVLLKKNILKFDIKELVKDLNRKIIVIGNLPYNISSQILIRLITNRNFISRAVVMLQKELIQRIVALPGCKDYGRLSVMLQYCAKVRKLASVKPASFFPRPKVDSQVLEIKFCKNLNQMADEEEKFFFKVIKAGFSKRRKTLLNALSQSELKVDPGALKDGLKESGIDPKRRAETISVQEFVKLSGNLRNNLETIFE